MGNRLVITIVLYQIEFSQTPSYLVLKQLLMKNETVHLFIYDNSEYGQFDELFEYANVFYIHDPSNLGLATAYNASRHYFAEVQGDLLLLLDQDTLLDQAYLEKLLQLPLDDEIGAYVPLINSHGRQISPVFSDEYIDRRSRLPKVGIYDERVMAINSGTALSKETVKGIGFNLDFSLDFLDHWLFWKLHQQHKKVSVLDSYLEHDLSVLDYQNVSDKRYESIINAESLFYQKYDQDKFYVHRRHLLFRSIKQFLRVKNRNIWRRTFSEYLTLMKGK
ncbi:glycosyltransferase [Candidatus Enterococcus mansonii]|uniref:Glycosyltransferase 2-like domain-containing protein n=1 Tax=Candidatus Enterococcus mansonii TaxID=1834181 RepID=A0A242CHX3_9ENTE|nr:glycosyltransferase [Enterococcus sp. 4G2_DIV0659]OTO09728.1 hypothetical protein A5880_000409 [Enterococcus sp. 4G2_DIV0659]